jgi:hypothetical protein
MQASEQTAGYAAARDSTAALRDSRFISAALAASIVCIVAVNLCREIEAFPGLHGDEAWIGLRAIEQQIQGMFTLHGMNRYTGSLFPQLAAFSFSMFSPDVGSLRLPGVALNVLALQLMTVALWRRGIAAVYFALLMGSSFLFLFYSRVAWEVDALQNVLLAAIFLAVTQLMRAGRSSPFPVLLFLLSFSIGCWNHAIFGTAALAFAAAANLIALKWPREDTARLALIGNLNLLLQAILLARYVVVDGPFAQQVLPALAAGLIVILSTTYAYLAAEVRLAAAAQRIFGHPRLAKLATPLIILSVALSLAASPANDTTFFGTVSGVILLERVASYVPGSIELAALHARMAILLVIFAVPLLAAWRSVRLEREPTLLPLLILWTIFAFPALRLATGLIADRYDIIPQFLFFCAVALAIGQYPIRWRVPLQLMLLAGFIHAQVTLLGEIVRKQDRAPLVMVKYGAYGDTSWHFLRLDGLASYLKARQLCDVRSSNFFIDQPLKFLMSTGQPCHGKRVVQVEYCTACASPVPWFELKVD